MAKQYYKRYALLQDTPTHRAGWSLRWDGSRRKYYYPKASTWGHNKGQEDIYLDYEGQSFTKEEVEAKPEWFKPVGSATDYVPAFPTKEEIHQYVDLEFETHYTDEDDVCRAMSDLFNDKDFKNDMYQLVKYKYEQFHNVESEAKSE